MAGIVNKVYYTRKDRKEQVIRSVSGGVYLLGLFAFFLPASSSFLSASAES